MAHFRAHSDDHLTPKVKPSNTGHAKHPAKKAPMSAKKARMLGGEQTSDGAQVEAKIARSRSKARRTDKTRH